MPKLHLSRFTNTTPSERPPKRGRLLLGKLRPLQKGIFLPPALFANAHLLLNKLRFAAELKNKNIRFLHAVSSYVKHSQVAIVDYLIDGDHYSGFANSPNP